jgi:hypothetical protein
MPCHMIAAATQAAAAITPTRKASFIEVEIYHIGLATAGGRLLFFSGGLRAVTLLKGRIDSLCRVKTDRGLGRAGH